MDAKEILRQTIRYRFWIVLGIAALLPIVGYFVTAGSVRSRTESKVEEITTAQQGAQSYASGTVPNGQYAQYTQQKIAAIEGDVGEAHRRLYERQAPLLDWPEEVAPQLTSWGRDIPEDVSANETQAVAYVYTQVYDDYAKNVFETVKPWDPVTGEGIVVTPPLEQLLQTVTFDVNNLPSITKIWQYQENLWVRRSILEVIAQVNQKAGATDWETAPLKSLTRVEVGNSTSVDHRTAAEGYDLKDPPEVTKGGQSLEPPAPAPGAGAGGMMGYGGDEYGGGMPGDYGGGDYGGMMPGDMMGMGMGMGMSKGGGPVRFLQPEGVELFRDYPAYVSVLIDQNSIQNFLVEFENSPMTMRVLEANWTRPKTRVQPPVKGQGFMGYAGMGGFGLGAGGGIFGMEYGMPGDMMGGYGGEYGMMGGYGGMMPGDMMGGYGGMMPGDMMGMMGPGMGRNLLNQPRQKVQRKDLLAKDKEKKDDREPEKVTIFDPYYNIVELQVYVQARFFYPPAPEEPVDEFSQGDLGLGDEFDDEPMIDDPAAAPGGDPAAADPAAPEGFDPAAPEADPADDPSPSDPADPAASAFGDDPEALPDPAVEPEPADDQPERP